MNELKFSIGMLVVGLLRLVPMPLPNVEPIMAGMLPFAKKYGQVAGFAFAFLALLSFDFISGRVGLWTVYTGVTYGIIGALAGRYFAEKRKQKMRYYLGFGVLGTLFYDSVTALIFGWQFGQPLPLTIAGQVPFTLYHLLGNLLMIGILTPLINRFIVENPALEINYLGHIMEKGAENRDK